MLPIPFLFLATPLIQLLLRYGIRQPERDKHRRTRLLPMRKIATARSHNLRPPRKEHGLLNVLWNDYRLGKPHTGSIAQTAGARRPRPYDLRASPRGGGVPPAQSQPTTTGRGRLARADHNTWGGGVPPALPSFDNGPRSHFLSAGPRRPRPNAASPHFRGGGVPPAQRRKATPWAFSTDKQRGRDAPAPFSGKLSRPLRCTGLWPYLMTRTRITASLASSAFTTSAGIALSVSISV